MTAESSDQACTTREKCAPNRFKKGKISTDALARLIAEEFEELNPRASSR
jgi:hypothetical protein